MVATKGMIPLLVAAAIGVLLLKSGKTNLTLVSAALAILTLWFVFKGKSS